MRMKLFSSTKRTFIHDEESFSYTLKTYQGSKCVRMIARGNGSIVVTRPLFVSRWRVETFMREHIDWIRRHGMRGTEKYISQQEHQAQKFAALREVMRIIEGIDPKRTFSYEKISIGRAISRWGSCSSRGHIRFSVVFLLLPESLKEYVVVHELCHLRHMNHSSLFWEEVRLVLPDWKQRRRALRDFARKEKGIF